ncbi:MAG: sugar ABC transporter permease, partial [Chloroflexi bacterium]|nr:sugar ABC transporter permease [Chloroflexota bacterium]
MGAVAIGREGRPTPWYHTRRGRRQVAGWLFISPWVIGFLIFTAGAMLFSLGLTLFDTDLLTETRYYGLRNFSKLARDRLFLKSLTVTATYVISAVPLQVATALAIALMLNTKKIVAIGVWRTLYYMPSIVSGIAVSLLWMWILNPDFGLLNYLLGLVGITGPRWVYSEQWAIPSFVMMGVWGAGSNMLLYLAGLQGIPTPLYEAAAIDGAGSWRRFWNITMPMLSPTVFFNLVMTLIGAFQVFTQAYVITAGGPNNATLTIVLFLYRKGFEQLHFGYASAVAWVLFVIIMAFTLLVFRSSATWV